MKSYSALIDEYTDAMLDAQHEYNAIREVLKEFCRRILRTERGEE
jgi:hypothetical protein